MTLFLAYMNAFSYFCYAWYIKEQRILVPHRVTLHSEVCHAMPFGVLYPVHNQPQGYQKAVVYAMFWRRQIQAMCLRFTTWSVINPINAITRPVPDRGAKRHLEAKFRFGLNVCFPLFGKMTG